VARQQKVAEVAEVRARLDGSVATLLTHYRGLSVKDMAQLRTQLREVNAELRIVKNTLAKRAVADAGIEGLDPLLEGPTGLVFCHDDPVGPAKALKAFAKTHPDLVIRGGYLDGAVMDAGEAMKLADLASREELLARMAGLFQGALSGFARLLQAQLVHQARLLQALIDDRVAKGETAPVAPASQPVASEEVASDDVAAAETVAEAPDAEAVTEPASEATEPEATEPEATEPASDEN
jgi:large subunit ribosomal protein L10